MVFLFSGQLCSLEVTICEGLILILNFQRLLQRYFTLKCNAHVQWMNYTFLFSICLSLGAFGNIPRKTFFVFFGSHYSLTLWGEGGKCKVFGHGKGLEVASDALPTHYVKPHFLLSDAFDIINAEIFLFL